MNDYDAYVKAEENVMLARVYEDDLAKREALYEKALKIQPINIDAWYGLIQTYAAKGATQAEHLALAKRIADTMVGYPLPMYNLLNVIKPSLTGTESVYQYMLIENKALTASSVLPNTATDKTLIPSAARVEAQYLLGNTDTSIADFSFDGEHAGCIVLSSRFDESGIRWKYSLDNKKTWKEVYFTGEEAHVLQLTAQELASVTEENDIYIQIVGVPATEENYYKIDISSKPAIPTTLYANDYENKILGLDERYEWRYSGETAWTSQSEAEPDCSGQKTVEVRLKATGGNPPSDVKSFAFTPDTDSETRKYVSVSHLSVEGYSSQSKDPKRPNYAQNAIDGNMNTYWHTDYAENVLTSGNTPYLILKLDTPKYISGVEFVQYQYSPKINIFAKNVKVSVSEDGEHWTEIATMENLDAIGEPKTIAFDESVRGQYIKIEMDTYGIFATVSMVNVYEDATKGDTNHPDTPNNPNNPNTPNNPNDPNGGDGGNGEKEPDGDNTAAIVIGVVVGAAVAAGGAATAAVIIVKRRKTK